MGCSAILPGQKAGRVAAHQLPHLLEQGQWEVFTILIGHPVDSKKICDEMIGEARERKLNRVRGRKFESVNASLAGHFALKAFLGGPFSLMRLSQKDLSFKMV